MTTQEDSTAYEEEHVHSVYEQIASHFSSTRYKPWPIIERFLLGLPPGSTGLDVGCGNGKYLAVNRDIFIVGSDRSPALSLIASQNPQHSPHAVAVADILSLPHLHGRFDFAISIAVVHHLATRERRIEAIKSVLEPLKARTGRALVYCWALEQEGSRRGWKEGGEQDVMVPWVMKQGKGKGKGKDGSAGAEDGGDGTGEKVFQRFYHLYCKGELEEDLVRAGGTVVESGYEKDNWWAIASRVGE